jgi:Arc/MetJ-type ribon-helix-helix transcriptional regulator
MTIKLTPTTKKILERRIKAGQFATPEEVIEAGLADLDEREAHGDFSKGELARLISEGEESIRRHGLLDGEEALRLRRQRRAARPSRKSA